MDYDAIIFWFVCFSCASGLVVTLARARFTAIGWLVCYLGILIISVVGWFWKQSALIYAAGAMWVVFALVPGLISRLYHRRFLQEQYSAARRLARIICWLHPADGWREQAEMIRAIELAKRGDESAAIEILQRFRELKSWIGLAAVTNLYRLANKWEELLDWHSQRPQQLERYPQLLPVVLRAYGETGNVPGLVKLYERHAQEIAKLVPAASRDQCRLALFIFCGKRKLAERLLSGPLAILPASAREFWLATADLAAGNTELAREQLERLLPGAEARMRVAIQRRLSGKVALAGPLDSFAEAVIESAAVEQRHEDSFASSRPLFSKQARATQIVIVLNVVMFAAEIYFGGATNPEALLLLGALYRPAVLAGEWWRLVCSLFLHFGPLHLLMNMLALWMLGPFAEFALGFRRFLLVYLLTGIGSMAIVLGYASGPTGQQLTVGASGSVMGLVGVTGALMLRGWWRERASSAKRRLIAILAIIGMQTAFDALVPHISMAAHLSGALIGFATTLILRDRLRTSQ